MAKLVAITTKDNPYDPFDQFEKWYMFDIDHGYDTCGYLGRVAKTSDALTPGENDEELEQAINEIIQLDFRDIYRKIVKNVPDSEIENEYYDIDETAEA